MARNFVQPGEVITFTAPGGGVVAGGLYLIGSLLVVAQNTAAAGLEFEGKLRGVFSVPKATGSAWTEGDPLYWNGTALTTTAGTNRLVGCAVLDAASAGTVGTAYLSGVPALPQPGGGGG